VATRSDPSSSYHLGVDDHDSRTRPDAGIESSPMRHGLPTTRRLFYDEMVGPGVPRPEAEALWRHFTESGPEALPSARTAADREMRAIGVTFTVYEGATGVDRPWPFDIIPTGRAVRTSGS
jgi:hypothetical protein